MIKRMVFWKILGLSFVIFFNCLSASAAPVFWPQMFLLQYPLLIAFGPQRPDDFAMVYGVYSPLRSPQNRNQYKLLSVGPEWEKVKACSTSARPHGYIHTSSIVQEGDANVKIAVPLSVKMKVSSILPDGSENPAIDIIKRWPLFKVTVLKLRTNGIGRSSLMPFYTEYFRVDQFIDANNGTQDAVVNFDSVKLTERFTIPSGTDYRIRLEWSADAICNDQEFEVFVGDQIRVVEAD